MTPFDRLVRARVYDLLVAQVRTVDSTVLADDAGWDEAKVSDSLARLAEEHRIVLTDDGSVRMAHPFSGVRTRYTSRIEDRWWWANCAWDSLAILALLGDGEAHGPYGLAWKVENGLVHPGGFVHLLVPARSFWDDVAFT
jgi:hypothetical protein